MLSRHCTTALLLAGLAACADGPTVLPSVEPFLAKGGGGGATLYKLRFIAGVNPAGDGEIVSDWFPAAGIAMDARAPWRSVSASNATVNLVNFTHGSWTGGTCATYSSAFTINPTNWDIAGTNPVRSFAGTWFGTVGVSRSAGGGYGLGFDGDRVVNGVVTPAGGGIHNVLAQGNQVIQTKDPSGNNDWFQIEFRDAFFAFGSASSPDGNGNPEGVEVACFNATVLAMRASLIAP
jgi:hypothetical protein